MRIIKRDHQGEFVWEYEGQLIDQTDHALLFRAHFNRSDLHFNGVLLREGDHFYELYPLGKWFNIYEIHDRDSDDIKAWYCNVTRPVVVEGDSLSYDDLALDLFVYPDGSYKILDEDEFVALGLTREDEQKARTGLQELINIFSRVERFSMDRRQQFI